jgi:hypothetical protein
MLSHDVVLENKFSAQYDHTLHGVAKCLAQKLVILANILQIGEKIF